MIEALGLRHCLVSMDATVNKLGFLIELMVICFGI
jgi:hypothetical protein